MKLGMDDEQVRVRTGTANRPSHSGSLIQLSTFSLSLIVGEEAIITAFIDLYCLIGLAA